MKRKDAKESLWNFFFAGLFLVIGTVCLWLGGRYAYDISMRAWSLCWLILGVGMLWMSLRERRREVPRNLQSLAMGLAYALLAVASWERGLRTGSGFYMAAGICWLALAAAWLVRAVRQFRNTTHKEEAV